MYGVLVLERADAVSMQHGIVDWPTLLSHAVAPEHSVGAGRIMRQTLLNVPCRHLLIWFAEVDFLIAVYHKFAKDRIALCGRNR